LGLQGEHRRVQSFFRFQYDRRLVIGVVVRGKEDLLNTVNSGAIQNFDPVQEDQ